MIQIGFKDNYIGSPGSFAEKYGKNYFICTGPAAMLAPVVVKTGEDWKGYFVIKDFDIKFKINNTLVCSFFFPFPFLVFFW